MAERISRAERFAGNRWRFCLVYAVVCAATTWDEVNILRHADVASTPSNIMFAGITDNAFREISWAAWLLIGAVYVFGGPSYVGFKGAAGAVVNDELTRAHQHSAALVSLGVLTSGVILGALNAMGYLSLPIWWPVALLGASFLSAAIAFVILEKRAQ